MKYFQKEGKVCQMGRRRGNTETPISLEVEKGWEWDWQFSPVTRGENPKLFPWHRKKNSDTTPDPTLIRNLKIIYINIR